MTLERKKHELFMGEALKEAKKAYEESINKKLVIIDKILESDSKLLINSFFEKIRK